MAVGIKVGQVWLAALVGEVGSVDDIGAEIDPGDRGDPGVDQCDINPLALPALLCVLGLGPFRDCLLYTSDAADE